MQMRWDEVSIYFLLQKDCFKKMHRGKTKIQQFIFSQCKMELLAATALGVSLGSLMGCRAAKTLTSCSRQNPQGVLVTTVFSEAKDAQDSLKASGWQETSWAALRAAAPFQLLWISWDAAAASAEPGQTCRTPATELGAKLASGLSPQDTLLWKRESGNPRVPHSRTAWHSRKNSEIRVLRKPTWQFPTELWEYNQKYVQLLPNLFFWENFLISEEFTETLFSFLLAMSQKEHRVCITSLCMYLQGDKCTKCSHILCRGCYILVMDMLQDMLFIYGSYREATTYTAW